MAEDFAVRINRRDGELEIEGPDKDWVAEQIDRLGVIYQEPPDPPNQELQGSPESQKKPRQAKRSKAQSADGPTSSKPRRSPSRGRASRKAELAEALTPEVKAALQAYVDERTESWNSKQTYQAAIIATFLMDNLNTNGWIDQDDLYTVYSVMGWSGPSNFRSTLNNARTRNGHFGTWEDGRLQISHAGEQFARHTSKN